MSIFLSAIDWVDAEPYKHLWHSEILNALGMLHTLCRGFIFQEWIHFYINK